MITSGFFNSLNGDRKYDMTQLSDLFNSLIKDGIFASIGTAFAVSASSGNTVSIGIGRAWFNSTWVFNSAIELIDCGVSEVLLNRYDAVVIEIDRTNAVRSGTVKVVKGTPSSSPTKPVMIDTELTHQYPLAFILRKAGSEEIVQADIQSMIGTSTCPYVSGILETQNIDAVVAQWNAEFATWFANLHTQLDSDVAGHLQNQVDELYNNTEISVETINAFIEIGFDPEGGVLISDLLEFATELFTTPTVPVNITPQMQLGASGFVAPKNGVINIGTTGTDWTVVYFYERGTNLMMGGTLNYGGGRATTSFPVIKGREYYCAHKHDKVTINNAFYYPNY